MTFVMRPAPKRPTVSSSAVHFFYKGGMPSDLGALSDIVDKAKAEALELEIDPATIYVSYDEQDSYMNDSYAYDRLTIHTYVKSPKAQQLWDDYNKELKTWNRWATKHKAEIAQYKKEKSTERKIANLLAKIEKAKLQLQNMECK